jgi:hypothetical protein
VRIFKTYGADAVQVISDNPYRLARDIRGIGFKSADQIARRLGIEKTAMIRARAGIAYALAEAMDEGHYGLPTEELRAPAAELLEIPAEVVDAALTLEFAEGAVVADTVEGRPCVFLAGLHRAEQDIAERLIGRAHVIDGDTLVVAGVHVRLQGVAAPEVAHPGLPHDEPGGPEAKAFLQELVEGRTVVGALTAHPSPSSARLSSSSGSGSRSSRSVPNAASSSNSHASIATASTMRPAWSNRS